MLRNIEVKRIHIMIEMKGVSIHQGGTDQEVVAGIVEVAQEKNRNIDLQIDQNRKPTIMPDLLP